MFLNIEIEEEKKSIAIVGFSSRLIVGLATNRDALLKTFSRHFIKISRHGICLWDRNRDQLIVSRQIVIRLRRNRLVVKGH
jgi:hypothetical protein